MIDEAHNEQMLWFTRRIVELEGRLAKMMENFNDEARRRHHEHELADLLAEQLRAVARGEGPFPFVARADREEAARMNDYTLPLEQWRRARPHLFRITQYPVESDKPDVEWP